MNGRRRRYTTDLEPIEGSEDLRMKIPEEILVSEDWRVGDVLHMQATPGRIIITNLSKHEREQFRGDMNSVAETDGQTNADAKASIPSDTDSQRRRTFRFKRVKLADLNQTPSISPLKGEAALDLLKQLGIAGEDGKPTKAYR